jgi:hypothetical protein
VPDSGLIISRQIRNLVLATVALYCVLGVVIGIAAVVFVMQLNRLHKDTVALCALRSDRIQNVSDVQRQIKDSKNYLRKHPRGAPALGISAADIKQSIASQEASAKLQRQTITSLAVVPCPKEGAKP